MRTGLPAALAFTGMIFLSFGITIAIIGLLGAKYGAPIHNQPLFGGAGLIIGGVLFGAGMMMGRSGK